MTRAGARGILRDLSFRVEVEKTLGYHLQTPQVISSPQQPDFGGNLFYWWHLIKVVKGKLGDGKRKWGLR
jgi:hypothetical protein